jgi:hypothetical protein
MDAESQTFTLRRPPEHENAYTPSRFGTGAIWKLTFKGEVGSRTGKGRVRYRFAVDLIDSFMPAGKTACSLGQ